MQTLGPPIAVDVEEEVALLLEDVEEEVAASPEQFLLVTAFSAPASSGYSAAYACVGNCGDFS